MGRGWVAAAVLLVAASVALVLHTLFDPNGWSRRQQVRADLERLRTENGLLEEETEDLGNAIRALRAREEVQERVIRDELGFVRPNEVVIELGK